MAVLGNLIVNLRLRAAKYVEGVEKAKKAQRRLDTQMRAMRKTVAGVRTELLAFVGVGGLGLMVKNAISAGSQLVDLNKRLGTTTEFLTEMQFATGQTGVKFEQFTMGIQRMNRRIAEAAQGTGEAKAALIELGLNAQRLGRMTIDEQFMEITRALEGVEQQSDKVRLAFKLFDSEGVGLLQTMAGGVDDLNKMREKARELGTTMSDEQAASLEKTGSAWGALQAQVTGSVQKMVAEAGPALTAIAAFLSDNLPTAINFSKTAFTTLRDSTLVAVQGIAGGIRDLSGFLAQLPGSAGEKFGAAQAKMNEVFQSLDKTLAEYRKAGNTEGASKRVRSLSEELAVASKAALKLKTTTGNAKNAATDTAKIAEDAQKTIALTAEAMLKLSVGDVQKLHRRLTALGAALAELQARAVVAMRIDSSGFEKGVNMILEKLAKIPREIVTVHRIVTEGASPSGGESRPTGGLITHTGSYTLERGERVVSNQNNVEVGAVHFHGSRLPSGAEANAWIRSVLAPGLARAAQRRT